MLAIRSQTGLIDIIIPYISHILSSGGAANKLRTSLQIYGLGFLEFEDANSTDHVVCEWQCGFNRYRMTRTCRGFLQIVRYLIV